MKYQHFESFLHDYAKSMSPRRSLNLSVAEKHVDGNSRFLSVLTFLFVFDPQKAKTLTANKDHLKTLYQSFMNVRLRYPGLNSQNVEKVVDQLDDLDDLRKLYQSYRHLVLDQKRRQKAVMVERILELKKEKRISNYRIYSQLHLNPGNTNDFIKHQRLNKMSVDNTRKILAFCQKNPGRAGQEATNGSFKESMDT